MAVALKIEKIILGLLKKKKNIQIAGMSEAKTLIEKFLKFQRVFKVPKASDGVEK